MAIDPNTVETTDYSRLDTLNLALTNYFAHSLPNGRLYKNTINGLATFMAPFVSSIGASGYVLVTGNTLPDPVLDSGFTIVEAGTYTQTGESSLVVDGNLNILSWNGTTWSVAYEINLDLSEYAKNADFITVKNLVQSLPPSNIKEAAGEGVSGYTGENYASVFPYDGYISLTGEVESGATYRHTERIGIPYGVTTLKVAFASSLAVAFYDNYGEFISTLGDSENVFDKEITIPAGSKSVVYMTPAQYITGGSDFDDHPAYLKFKTYAKYSLPWLTVKPGNIVDVEESDLFFAKIDETNVASTFPNSGYIDEDGVPQAAGTYKYTDKIELNGAIKVKLSFSSTLSIAFYDSSNVFISTLGSAGNYFDYTINIPENADKMAINMPTSYLPGGVDYDAHPAYANLLYSSPKYIIPWLMVEPEINGLLWTSLGDSITFQGQWQPRVIERTGLVHTNCGVNSSQLAGASFPSNPRFWESSRLNAVKASNPDILTILGGANDLVGEIPIGSDSEYIDKTVTTFKGSYSYIIDNLLTWKPSLKIIILTTTWAWNDGVTLAPASGLRYTNYANASKEVAAYFGLKCVDLHSNANFNAYTEAIYFPDHIHPNAEGGKRIGECVVGVLKDLIV